MPIDDTRTSVYGSQGNTILDNGNACIRTAGSHLRPLAERIDAAGPHVADIATQPQFAESAKGLEGVVPVPNGLRAQLARVLQHLLRGGVRRTMVLAHGFTFVDSSPASAAAIRSISR